MVPSDLRMSVALWPILVASAVGLLPFTVFGTFLVPISEAADTGVAAVGSLRGLGGVTSLLVGVGLAPLIGRLPRKRTAAGGLALLGVSAALGAVGNFLALAAFCLLVGAATAILNPTLATAAVDRFGDGPAAGRAATLVTATQSLTAMLAAPVVALPALLWGWRGDLVSVSAISLALAAAFLGGGKDGDPDPEGDQHLGYVASFRELAAVPGAVPLLLVALLRTAAFMGYLAYLAAFYGGRFGLSPGLFAFVWTLSGASFFLGNLVAGRYANSAAARMKPDRLLIVGLAAALVSVAGVYCAPVLPLALVFTALLGASHATAAACVVSLLVGRCEGTRASALSLMAAGMSLGVFLGSAFGGAGLGLAGYPGMALALGSLTLAALVAALVVSRPGTPAPPANPECG